MLQQLELPESASKWHCQLEVWTMDLGNEEWPVESPGGTRESRGGGRWDVPERKFLTVCGTYVIAFPRSTVYGPVSYGIQCILPSGGEFTRLLSAEGQ